MGCTFSHIIWKVKRVFLALNSIFLWEFFFFVFRFTVFTELVIFLLLWKFQDGFAGMRDVYYKGSPICAETHHSNTPHTTWDINAATVVCRMLGFSRALQFYQDQCGLFGGCPKGVPWGESGFKCNGSEFHIMDCPHDATLSPTCGSNGVTDANDSVGVLCA